jgi:hypothetical protein
MAGFTIKGKVDGLGAVKLQLRKLQHGARRVEEKMVRRGCGIVLKDAKARCPVSTDPHLKDARGLLKKSLGIKIARLAKAIVGIIGARRGFKKQVGTVTRGPRKGQPIYQDPANIHHLVEFGTRPHSLASGDTLDRTVKGVLKKGRQTSGARMHPGAKAKPHMRPAWDSNRGPVLDAMAETGWAEIDKLARG